MYHAFSDSYISSLWENWKVQFRLGFVYETLIQAEQTLMAHFWQARNTKIHYTMKKTDSFYKKGPNSYNTSRFRGNKTRPFTYLLRRDWDGFDPLSTVSLYVTRKVYYVQCLKDLEKTDTDPSFFSKSPQWLRNNSGDWGENFGKNSCLLHSQSLKLSGSTNG